MSDRVVKAAGKLQEENDRLEKELAASRKREGRLRTMQGNMVSALKKYGRHSFDCKIGKSDEFETVCTCRFLNTLMVYDRWKQDLKED